jgi:ribonuclease PH
MAMRSDQRDPSQLRIVKLIPNYVDYPEGSVLIVQGNTRVLCNVSVEQGVPNWMKANNLPGGWITAEYAMLPRATHLRTSRETSATSGRTYEIRRLIGRSLRAAIDLNKIGALTYIIDCDVLQADGGTRTAAITGGFAALAIALKKMVIDGVLQEDPVITQVAAVSVGILNGIPILDLSYQEDSAAEVDANIVMTAQGDFVEIQASAEKQPFSYQSMGELLDLAKQGISHLFKLQNSTIAAG